MTDSIKCTVHVASCLLVFLLADGTPLPYSRDNHPLEDVHVDKSFIPVTDSRNRRQKKEWSLVVKKPEANKLQESHGAKKGQPDLVRMYNYAVIRR